MNIEQMFAKCNRNIESGRTYQFEIAKQIKLTATLKAEYNCEENTQCVYSKDGWVFIYDNMGSAKRNQIFSVCSICDYVTLYLVAGKVYEYTAI